MKILVAEKVGTLSGERVEVLEKKHQATCITNSKHSERTRRKSICCLGLHSRLRWLLAVKKKGKKKNPSKSERRVQRRKEKKKTMNFWQVKCRIIRGQTKKQLW